VAGFRRADAQVDTLAMMRQFLRICNEYKQLPLQLDVDIRSSSNWVVGSADTASMHARFNLCGKGSYIVMDGLEQLANDSLMLVVNERTLRMNLYLNRQPVAARLQQYLGRQLQDSGVAQWARKYAVAGMGKDRDTAFIKMESRALLPYTELAKQEIRVDYDEAGQRPYTVRELDRTLVPVDDSLFRLAAARSEWVGKTVSVGDSAFYLVRERVRAFRFRVITHLPQDYPPVQMSDRIVADLAGRYRPVKAYSAYRLTQPF
jgi:hypothetical protein